MTLHYDAGRTDAHRYLREMADSGYNPETIGPFHEFMIPWLMAENGVSKDDVVVDTGAGQGHCLLPLRRSGWKRLIAVDIDDYNFAFFGSRGISTVRCDMGSEPLGLADSVANAVICFHLIEHLTSPDNLLTECRRVLKDGGVLFLVTPDWRKQYKTFWRDPTHLRPYDKESLARLLRMYKFEPTVFSWNARFGLGRLRAYRWFPRLGMIGEDMLVIGINRK